MARASTLQRTEVQALARALSVPARISSAEILSHVAAKVAAEGEAAVELSAVREAFSLIDVNGDGVLSRIEVIKAVRTHKRVRALLKLPHQIRQEDGTRDAFEMVFQQIDTDDSKTISAYEFESYFFPTAPGEEFMEEEEEGTSWYGSLVSALKVIVVLLCVLIGSHLALAPADAPARMERIVDGGGVDMRAAMPSTGGHAAGVDSDAELGAQEQLARVAVAADGDVTVLDGQS